MTDPVVGVDYSYARPGGAALAAGGYRFAIRYLAEDGRGITDDEVRDLHAHGVAVVAVYEGRGSEPLNGYEQGVADGAYAHRKMAELGFPESRPCYFAVDFDVIGAQLGPIGSYFRGVAASMGVERVGVYGDTDAMGYLRQYGLARWFWQAMAPAWSQYKAFDARHIYQYAGGTVNGGAVDFNLAYAEDYGQWAGEEQVTREEYDALMRRIEDIELGVWSGSEEKDATGVLKSRPERLEAAAYRRDAIAAGNAQSIGERATSALIRPPATIPPHEHDLPAATTGGVSQ